jgi:cytochrome c553
MPMNYRRVSSLVVLFLLANGLRAEEPLPEQVRFFETRVRPILATHCQKCHGAKKQRGDLRLDSREAILRGGDSGPAAVVGEPDKSLLLRAVRHTDADLKMPPDMKLSDRDIADLARWVKLGLPFPAAYAVKSPDGAAHWAFRPPAEPPVPPVKNTAWPRSDLDRFILARLEAKGLRPAAPADRRTLIRRATFDLTGLPPTPAEIDAFLSDASPQAFERVVDRLLASPRYGERWARHWLDVARYADSNGLDENVAYGTAWRYRDYVVAAFNADTPYDQFLLEQLAGDLLPTDDPATRRRRLIATGFLSLGPKVLAEVDERKMEMDIIDEQVDTVGRTVLGLTLGCARCHDHKFDPLPTEDYYGLAGMFKSTRTMEHFRKVARWHENPIGTPEELARKAEHEKMVAKKKQAVAAAAKTAKPAELKALRAELAALEKAAPEVPTALGVTDGAVVDVPVHVRGNHLKLGKVVPRHVPVVLAGPTPPTFDDRQSGRLQLARWLTRPDHPLTARVLVNRVWRWHFGHGIVRTTDNFGRLGEKPDNPGLLDWLARRFVADGWSLKALHRRILLSSTYRMSASTDPRAAEIDPENRLHGRAEVRRLEAEAIRDALLAVTGTLDPAAGGPVLQVKNRDYLFDHTSRDMTTYDSRRRSIYLPVVRNNVYDVFQLFDFPDPAVPNGDRATTTVAPQALFLMNSDFVGRLCDHLAGELLKGDTLDDAARVRRLYRRAYGREATDAETAAALALVRDVDRVLQPAEADAARRRLRAWSSLCQTVVAANEFVYIK